MIIIETCPKCGHDLYDVVLAVNPPIPQKKCFNCGWEWTGEPEQVLRVPFDGNSLDYDKTWLHGDTDYEMLNATDSMVSRVCNDFEEKYNELQREYLGKWIGLESRDVDYPDCCDGCSNNPKNGGSGICNCTLPYMQNPIMYNANPYIDDCCMTATTSTGAYIFGKEKPDAEVPYADAHRIAEAVERTKKYMRK